MASDALFEAILDDPDDDGVRLVYADWLEEHGGQARAEFIRLQLAGGDLRLAHWKWSVKTPLCAADMKTRVDLAKRAYLLLKANARVWDAPLLKAAGCKAEAAGWWTALTRLLTPEWPKRPLWSRDYSRGFVDRIHIDMDAFVTRSHDLFQAAPLRGVNLSFGTAAHHAALLATPFLPRLSSLDLSGCDIDDAVTAELAGLLTPGRLTELGLADNNITARGVQALALSGVLRGVSTLELHGNCIGALGAQTLAASDLAALDTLGLSFTSIGDEGVEALAASPALTNLGSLNLQETGLGPAGAHALAASPYLNNLGLLNLHDSPLDAASREALTGRFPHALITF
jgi:uncharacterized protein (TIGR02996 family)